jgi:hypothetical protein
VAVDDKGEGFVQLPAWFGSLNKEYRYCLTAIGVPAPNLHIAQEIEENYFRIAGGKSRTRVCWQVTGIRHDPYAEHHRIQVEQDKSVSDRGRYIHPLEHGLPQPRVTQPETDTQGATMRGAGGMAPTMKAKPPQTPRTKRGRRK